MNVQCPCNSMIGVTETHNTLQRQQRCCCNKGGLPSQMSNPPNYNSSQPVKENFGAFAIYSAVYGGRRALTGPVIGAT